MFPLTFCKLVGLVTLVVFASASEKSAWQKSQVLVVFDSAITSEEVSLGSYFQPDASLYEVTFKDYSSKDEQLFTNGEPTYDHIVFMPTSKRSIEAKGLVDKHALLEFFNRGGNILAVGSGEHSIPEEVRLFLNQAGIYPAPKGYVVLDHFNQGVLLDSKNLIPNNIVSTLKNSKYEGTGALISNNELVIPLIKAPKLSFTSNPKDKVLTADKTWTTGEQGFLAVAFQGLNNARAAWVGSLDLVSSELCSWVFQAKGVIKLQFVQHYKQDEPGIANRTLYRIKDPVYYTVGVSELSNGKWIPYTHSSDEDVLQLSFKMLDPYQRLNMTLLGPAASVENGEEDMNLFYVEFVIPDHHGMFTFEFDYKRKGLSFLEDRRVVTVRHLANDEYKRSWEITNSWMYMASAAMVVASWFVFVLNFLFIGSPKKTEKLAQEEASEKK